jgi:hypothetical protein
MTTRFICRKELRDDERLLNSASLCQVAGQAGRINITHLRDFRAHQPLSNGSLPITRYR